MRGKYNYLVIAIVVSGLFFTMVGAEQIVSGGLNNTNFTERLLLNISPVNGNGSEVPETINRPDIRVNIETVERVTRGETVEVRATAINLGAGVAKNTTIALDMPFGFEGERTWHFCGDMEIAQICEFKITVKTSLDTSIGITRIKVRAIHD